MTFGEEAFKQRTSTAVRIGVIDEQRGVEQIAHRLVGIFRSQVTDPGGHLIARHLVRRADNGTSGRRDGAPQAVTLYALRHGLRHVSTAAARSGDLVNLAEQLLGKRQIGAGKCHAHLVCGSMGPL